MTDATMPSYVPKVKRTGLQVASVFGSKNKPVLDLQKVPAHFLRKVQFMEKYTDSLKQYIVKSFSQCTDKDGTDLVSERLLLKINELSARGALGQYNWDQEPLVSPLRVQPNHTKQTVKQKPAAPRFQQQAPQWIQQQQWTGYNPVYQTASQFQQPQQGQWQPVQQAPVPNTCWQPPEPAPTFDQLPKQSKKKAKKERQAAKSEAVFHVHDDHEFEELMQENRIVGTSTDLEKPYLRSTGGSELMKASYWRPLPVLKQSLEYCMNKYAENNDYEYISEQLRSIRQDMTVQHIHDPFCVQVYETHAKLAIQYCDWESFNVSMNPLEELYAEFGEFENICEIWCYRILYLLGVDDLSGLYSFIPRMKREVRESPAVQYAINVWKVANSGEWVKYFNMMNEATPLCASVMGIKAASVRSKGLVSMGKSYRCQKLNDYKTMLFVESDEEMIKILKAANVKVPDE